MTKARRSETSRALARLPPTAAQFARFAAPAATYCALRRSSGDTNRRNSGWTAAPWVHKNRPAIIESNDRLIKLGLFEPDGACSTAMMIGKQVHRDNIRALRRSCGDFLRASPLLRRRSARFAAPAATFCALRRSCGDNLRASDKTAPADRAAATPDCAVKKALTHSHAGAGESYKI